MDFVAGGGKSSRVRPKGPVETGTLGIFGSYIIDLLVVIRIRQMNLVGGYSDNGSCASTSEISKMSKLTARLEHRTVFSMQLFNLCIISASADIAEEECVEMCHRCESRAWNFGKWMEIASVHVDTNEPNDGRCREITNPRRRPTKREVACYHCCRVKSLII